MKKEDILELRRFIETEKNLGIDDALDTLPELMNEEVTTLADVMNDVIKKIRIEHGLTQNDLANILDVSRQKYNCYERSGYNISISRMAKIAKFYNISLDCLSGSYWKYKPFYPNLKSYESEAIKFILENKKPPEILRAERFVL